MKPERLFPPDGPWLHVLAAGDSDACDLLLGLQKSAPSKVAARAVRGDKATTLAQLFDEFAAAFQFPYYFGANWDAFKDCLTDLEWLPGHTVVAFVTRATHLLEREPAEQLKRFFDVWKFAAEAGRDENETRTSRSYHLILQCDPEDEAALKKRLQGMRLKLNRMALGG